MSTIAAAAIVARAARRAWAATHPLWTASLGARPPAASVVRTRATSSGGAVVAAGGARTVVPDAARPAWAQRGKSYHNEISGVVEGTRASKDGHGVDEVTIVAGDGAGHEPYTAAVIHVEGRAPPVFPGEYVVVRGNEPPAMQSTMEGRSGSMSGRVVVSPLPESIVDPHTFLQSGVIKRITYDAWVQLTLLCDHYDLPLNEALEEKHTLVPRLSGFGPVTSERLLGQWRQMKRDRELYIALADRSRLGPDLALTLIELIAKRDEELAGTNMPREDPVKLLEDNPYKLMRAYGLDFGTADRIANNLGVPLRDPRRVVAAALDGLKEAESNGHCGLEVAEAKRATEHRLGARQPPGEFEKLVEERSEFEVIEVAGRMCCFEQSVADKEKDVAMWCAMLANGNVPWTSIRNPANHIDEAGRLCFGDNFEVSDSQRAALETIMQSKLTVLTGGPGVGKTRIVAVLIAALKPLNPRVLVAAPTGRAAARLRDSMGVNAVTLHRLLGIDHDGVSRRDVTQKLKCDLLIVDEASMLSLDLMHRLMAAMPTHAALLLVGDVDQLPSVSPGDVLVDLLRSGVCKVVELTEVHRQASDSDLVRTARLVRDGVVPDIQALESGDGDTRLVGADWPGEAVKTVIGLVAEEIPLELGVDANEIQVLCPTRHRGDLSVSSLNARLQSALNPANEGLFIRGFDSGVKFRLQDKVMQQVNDYDKEVHNGDVGIITMINSHGEGSVEVTFRGGSGDGDARVVSYTRDEIDDNLSLAYACTVHKAQGSEYDAVVIVLDGGNMVRRSLLYTAMTRARKRVYIVGSADALKCAVHNNDMPDVSVASPSQFHWGRTAPEGGVLSGAGGDDGGNCDGDVVVGDSGSGLELRDERNGGSDRGHHGVAVTPKPPRRCTGLQAHLEGVLATAYASG